MCTYPALLKSLRADRIGVRDTEVVVSTQLVDETGMVIFNHSSAMVEYDRLDSIRIGSTI